MRIRITMERMITYRRSNNNVKEALNCFTSISRALKERFIDKIARLCNDVNIMLIMSEIDE